MITSQEQKGVIIEGSCQAKLLADYLDFLNNHRGLAESTIRFRINYALSFLKSLSLRNGPGDIGRISVKQVHDYVTRTAKHLNRPSRKHLVGSIRSFLRFAHIKGYVPRDLTEAVPAFATPRLGSIPRGIPWESVEKLLAAAANRKTRSGRRSYAVLKLLAAYGVRIGQVIRLRLQDINWREGSIYFRPSKEGNPLHFPLYPDVAEALLSYIREARGKVSFPEVFLTVNLDPIPIGEGRHLSSPMKTCFRRAGIPHRSAHAIRHAFATRLMEQDTPMKTIADLLGHKYLGTTFIYTKVDLKHLRLLASEWPEV